MDSVNPDPTTPADDDSTQDDITLQNYQDDLDTSSSITDPVMTEGDDITEELGVNPKEFKKELDHYDFGTNGDTGNDDRREQLEDMDQEAAAGEEPAN